MNEDPQRGGAVPGGAGGLVFDPTAGVHRDPTTGIAMPAELMDMLGRGGGGPSGGGFGGIVGADGGAFAGAPYRSALAPNIGDPSTFGDQNYSDASGQPAHVGGPPPAFAEKGTEYDFPNIFNQGAPPSGWFTLNDYYGQPGRPGAGAEYGRDKVPEQFTVGSNLPSTNNWRLLPQQYRDPDFFMVNGQPISRSQIQRELHPSIMGLEGGTWDPGFGIGKNVGVPRIQMGGGGGGFLGQVGGYGPSYWGMGGMDQ